VVEDMSEGDGLPAAFRTMADRDRRTYKRFEQGGRIRWISEDGLNELVPILGAEAIDRPFRGQSQVSPLYYAVTQNVEGKRHNSSMLRNGLRTTGVIHPPEGASFDAKTMERMQAAIQALRGSGSAGSTLILPKRVESIDLAISNQEMDYVAMLAEAKEAVFNYYNIPLPLVMNDASTFNNYSTAQTAFFDGAVFPVFDDLADAFAGGLAPRFPELEGMQITYNENAIRALKGRNIERMRKSRETNALTTNEIREVGGYPAVTDGDDVLVPSTFLPLGVESMIGDVPLGVAEETDEAPNDGEPTDSEV
jgi:phage portal protein BeeE